MGTVKELKKGVEVAPEVNPQDLDGGPDGERVDRGVSIYSPSRDPLDGAGRMKATPEEASARIALARVAAKDRLLELDTAVGYVDRDVRGVDAAMAAKREEITDAKALIPASQAMPDIEDLLVQAGLGDEEAEKKIVKIRKDNAVVTRLAAEKEAKVLDDVKPREAQLAALERHAAKLYRNLFELRAEKKEAVTAFLEAERGVLDWEGIDLARKLEEKIFRQVNVNDMIRRTGKPTPWASGFRDLLIPPVGPYSAELVAPADRFHGTRTSIVGIGSDDELVRLDELEDRQMSEYAAQGLSLDIPPSPSRIARETPPRVKEPRAVEPGYREDCAPCHLVRPDPASELPAFAITETEIFK